MEDRAVELDSEESSMSKLACPKCILQIPMLVVIDSDGHETTPVAVPYVRKHFCHESVGAGDRHPPHGSLFGGWMYESGPSWDGKQGHSGRAAHSVVQLRWWQLSSRGKVIWLLSEGFIDV